MNGHLAKKATLHYRTHNDVKNGINPHNPTAICKVTEDVYLAYCKLESLSRRARYLCHEEATAGIQEQKHVTHDKHLAKAVASTSYKSADFGISVGVSIMELPKKHRRF